jgi:TonB-linked SusC/RagA family outer membrane protein
MKFHKIKFSTFSKRKVLKNYFALFIMLLFSTSLYAQSHIVSGTVKDAKGVPLIGVTVQIQGNQNVGTVTDVDGKFSINAPANAILVFSYLGYLQQTASASQHNLKIEMSEDTKKLDEVVVVGYTSQKRANLTSAVAVVSGDELVKQVAANDPTALMQGVLPGVQVTQNSGQPGSEGVNLLVRGEGTFSGAGVNPLIIVDGLPGSMSSLNVNDIESITLLKDAASEAVYGSRGANGVIVVTTKTGKKNDGFKLSYDYKLGITNVTRLPSIVTNSAEYMGMSNTAYSNTGLSPLYTQAQIDLYQNATDRVKYPNHNWLNDIFQTAYVQQHYLSLSNGNANSSYSLGLGIMDQPGTMIGFSYKKYTLNLGLTSKVTNRITIGTNIQMRYGLQNYPEDGAGDFFLSALAQSPLYPAQSDGKWIADAYSNEKHNKNPVALVGNNIITRVDDYYLQGNLSINIELIKDLIWENKFGANFDTQKTNDFRPVISEYNYSDMSLSGNLDDGTPGLYVNRNDNVYSSAYSQLDFKKKIGNHNLSILAGAQEEYNTSSYIDASRQQYTTNLLRELNAGPTSGMTNDGSSSAWALESLYGIANYEYQNKYLIGASIRCDGTSRLPSGTRWGTFYSFSGGWRISQENFLKDVQWLSSLKIRGSWGELGNQNIGTYPYQSVLSYAPYAFSSTQQAGYVATSLVSPTLSWETTRVLDFGLDASFFKNKLTFTADWYNKYTYNILRSSQVAYWLGLNAPTVNDGAVRNDGCELSTQYRDKLNKDLSFTIGANFQSYKNRLVSFGSPEINGNSIMEEGQSINTYYLYKWIGIFQSQAEINSSPKQPVTPTPGDLKFQDINGDGVINDKDRVPINADPKFQYGGNLSVNWKNFDFNAQVFGSYGGKIYVTGWGIEPFTQGSVPTTDWEHAWTTSNPTNSMPKLYVGGNYAAVDSYYSTYFLKSDSYFRLSNLSIGYTLPSNLINKSGFRSLRIYVSASNLFTLTSYPGLDPERVGGGSYVNYPQNKVLTFGATLQF